MFEFQKHFDLLFEQNLKVVSFAYCTYFLFIIEDIVSLKHIKNKTGPLINL